MRVGTFWGIPLFVHPLFLVLFFLISALGYLPWLLLVLSVLLWHEGAHILEARNLGLRVCAVELLPFGGVVQMEDLVQLDPAKEIRVCLAGPLSNLLLLLLGYGVDFFASLPSEWFSFFIQVNAGLLFMNLLPALPLDGGRVFRSLLTKRMGFRLATEKAALFARVIAFFWCILGMIGFYYYGYGSALFLVVISLFLYLSAQRELEEVRYVLLRYMTQKKTQLRLRRVMPMRGLTAMGETSVGEILSLLVPSDFHLVWVVSQEGEFLGVVSELQLIKGLFEKGIHGKLKELVRSTESEEKVYGQTPRCDSP